MLQGLIMNLCHSLVTSHNTMDHLGILQVTAVQELLTNHFHQIFHLNGSNPAPPSGPIPSYYTVSGGGSASWNGKYVKDGPDIAGISGGSGEGTQLSYTSTTCKDCQLYPSPSGVWRIAIQGKELFYVAALAASLPPLTGWTVANGTAPAPTLVAGPAVVGSM
jgi:hypothetical protein